MTNTEKAASRGRPRKFDLETGLSTALQLFSRHGYDAVGISELCTALGITPTSLYAAYASKFNLFQRAIDRYANGSGRFVSEALLNATNTDDLWHSLLHAAAVQYASGSERGCPVLDGLLGARDPDVAAYISARVEATEAAIRDHLIRLGDSQADTNALAIMVVMRGLSASARAGASVEDLTLAVENLLQVRRRSED